MFLRNNWYVAAWRNELEDGLNPVELLGDRIVLYRRSDGTPVALEDACPHRKLPLSMGRLEGDRIECGYHGLTFDGAGACTRAPGSPRATAVARVRSYPAEERYGLIWLWMGDPAVADIRKIPPVDHYGDPAWGMNRGQAMTVDCHYLYLTDNLLDPTHVAWVHKTSFGNADCEEEPLDTKVEEIGVTVSRWMFDIEPAPFYARYLKFAGRCDRKQHYEVRYPCNAIIRAIFVPAGTGGEGRPLHEDAFLMDSYNFLTPINEHQTRYFWFQLRNFSPDDENVSNEFSASVRDAFEEDRLILNAVHKGMAEKKTANIDLKSDLGARRFRRGLSTMIGQENPA